MFKAWFLKMNRFKGMNFNKRYAEGYEFAMKELKKGISIKELVASSVGPDNHDEGLRDACSDFSYLHPEKVVKERIANLFC